LRRCRRCGARPRRPLLALVALRRRLALGLPLGLAFRLTVQLRRPFRPALGRTLAGRALGRFAARSLFRRRRACDVEIGAVDLAADGFEIDGDVAQILAEIVDVRRARGRRF